MASLLLFFFFWTDVKKIKDLSIKAKTHSTTLAGSAEGGYGSSGAEGSFSLPPSSTATPAPPFLSL